MRYLPAIAAFAAVQVGTAGMEQAAEGLPPLFHLQVEQLEYRQGGGNAVAWEAYAWYGGDFDKALVKTEGERGSDGAFEKAEVQLLYSRLLTPFLDIQAGLRQDFRPEPGRSLAVLGLAGELPYGLEIDLAGFASDRGDLSARLELEYDLPITLDLVLQPKLELDAAVQEVPALHLGSGLTQLETGLRLRYHLSREVAPYLGIGWERKLGRTSELAEAEGEDPGSAYALVGIRFWF